MRALWGGRVRVEPALALAVAAAALAGCSAPGAPAVAPADGGAAAAQPKYGGFLRQLLPYSAQVLDPHLTEDYTAYGFVSQFWFEGLTSLEYIPGQDWRIENKAVPLLAEGWKLESPTSYLFTVRQGVKFHNGDPLTADDVVFSLQRMQDPNLKVNPQVSSNVSNIASVEKVDDLNVRVTTRVPQPDLVVNLSTRNVSIVPRRFVEGGGDLGKQPIGTGPFKLASYQKDGEALAVRNDAYWRPGRPYLDGIKSVLKVDDATVTAAVAAGQADVAVRGDKPQFEATRAANPNVQFRRFTNNSLHTLYFNASKPPFSDKRVRTAIHLALDRQEMDRAMNFGDGVQTGPLIQAGKTGWTIPDDELLKLPGYRQPKEPDQAEAKRLLAEAGYPDGFKTTITYNPSVGVSGPSAETSQAQLKRFLNITSDLVPVDSGGTMVQKQVKGDYDILSTSTGYMDNPLLLAVPFFHSSGVYAKAAGIKDPEVDRLIDAISQEFDASKRASEYVELQRVLLDRLYAVPLPQATLYQVWQPWVHDWVGNFNARAEIRNSYDVWMDVEQTPADRRKP